MRDLGFDDFSGAIGKAFEVAAGDSVVTLILGEAQPLGPTQREGGSFSLVFVGPQEPVLPQAIYRFSVDGEAADIFIVPVASDRDGTRYEAIFN